MAQFRVVNDYNSPRISVGMISLTKLNTKMTSRLPKTQPEDAESEGGRPKNSEKNPGSCGLQLFAGPNKAQDPGTFCVYSLLDISS